MGLVYVHFAQVMVFLYYKKNNSGNFQVNHHSVNQDQSAEISSVIKNEINL